MKYGYTVKHNGTLYPAGVEVPVSAAKATVVEENTEDNGAENNAVEYTRTIINKLSAEDAKKLAKEQGLVDADEQSGNACKKWLLEKFGL